MQKDGHWLKGRSGRALVAVACLLGLMACTLRPSAPENRAEYFVKKLIFEPDATDDLRAVAWLGEDQAPETLLADLPTRAAFTYLRARARLGFKPRVHATAGATGSSGRMPAQVLVTETVAAAEPVGFTVQLEQRDEEWRVTAVRAN